MIEELADFLEPLERERVRTDDERDIRLSFTSALLPFHFHFVEHNCERLNGLAEAHVVAQGAV